MKTWFKRMSIGLILLLVLMTLGLWIWSESSSYPAGELARASLESSEAVSVSSKEWIVFEPNSPRGPGVIFYPGGLVDPAAYAPILRNLADAGYLAVITPMPFNLAIFNTDTAQAVQAAFPDILTWVIAGHSLGGAAASIHAENEAEDFAALILWDSFPANYADLSDNAISVISIFGTHNQVPNPDGFNDTRSLLPANTQFVGIEGANHTQFGDYGAQDGDIEAQLSQAEQHEIVTDLVLEFLRAFED
jgi:pimeloyl-ACP methyl ester carboxylesterase